MGKRGALGMRARGLAWAAAGLLAAGVVSAGAIATAAGGADGRIVTAAGDNAGVVDLRSPTTVPVTAEPPTAPSTTPSTAVKPASSPPTTRAAGPVTTPPQSSQPPRSTTTAPTAPTTTVPRTAATTTTPTTVAGRATVTIVSQYAYDVDVILNGQAFRVTAGQSVGPLDIALAANGNDSVEVRVVSAPTCGEGDAGGYFTAGGRFRLTVVPLGTCGDAPGMQAPTVRSASV